MNRLGRDTAFQHVVDRGEMEIHYQPLVSLSDRRIIGAEALVRWNDPDHGMLLPGQFITLAERNGTIVELEQMVLEQACRQAKTWHQEFGATLQIGVERLRAARAAAEPGRARRRRAAVDRTAALAALPRDQRGHRDARRGADLERPLANSTASAPGRPSTTSGRDTRPLATWPGFPSTSSRSTRVRAQHRGRRRQVAIVSAVVRARRRRSGRRPWRRAWSRRRQLQTLTDLECAIAQGYYFARPMSAANFGKMLTASADVDLRLLGSARAG